MKPFRNGLYTGIILQLAVGPIFFFIMSLTLQRSFWDGFAGVLAVTLVDYFYISLAIFGIGKALQKKKFQNVFGIVSSLVLIVFGLMVISNALNSETNTPLISSTSNLMASFISILLLTLSSPLTIVFFTSIFTARAVEYNYSQNNLIIFGLGTGLATLLFMGCSVIIFSLIKGSVPTLVVEILNVAVGCVLIGYGVVRFWKLVKKQTTKKA